jgi:hypothetical protein
MSSSTTLFSDSDSQDDLSTSKVLLLAKHMSKRLDKAMKHNRGSMEMAVLYLMRDYTFDFDALLKCLEGLFRHPHLITSLNLNLTIILTYPVILDKHLNFSFSNIEFKKIFPLVGLDSYSFGVSVFEVHRARITNELFSQILKDIEVTFNAYGHPVLHENEVTRFQFLSPASLHRFSEPFLNPRG